MDGNADIVGRDETSQRLEQKLEPWLLVLA